MVHNRKIVCCLIVLFILSVTTGCLSSKTGLDDGSKVLRVFGNELTVNQDKTYFEIAYPDVKVEVIDTNQIAQELQKGSVKMTYAEKIMEVMTGPNPPDVIYFGFGNLVTYLEDDLLAPLDNYIAKDKFNLDEIAPPVIEMLQELGGGPIYALAPTFSSKALYYNKELFDKMNLPYPEAMISWEDLFHLASALTHVEDETEYYGLAFDTFMNPYAQLEMIMQPYNLNIFNYDFTQVNVNTPTWNHMWEIYSGLHRDGVIAPYFDPFAARESNQQSSFLDRERFLAGRSAMAIGELSLMNYLNMIKSGNVSFGNAQEQAEPFEWGIIPLPIHPEVGEVSGGYALNHMIGINSNSNQPELAWEYVSFMNGDKKAQVEAERGFQLVSRINHYQNNPEFRDYIDAFTALKPQLSMNDIEFMKTFPGSNVWYINNIGSELFNEVIEGSKSVEEALAEFETRGSEVLEQLRFEKNNATKN